MAESGEPLLGGADELGEHAVALDSALCGAALLRSGEFTVEGGFVKAAGDHVIDPLVIDAVGRVELRDLLRAVSGRDRI